MKTPMKTVRTSSIGMTSSDTALRVPLPGDQLNQGCIGESDCDHG